MRRGGESQSQVLASRESRDPASFVSLSPARFDLLRRGGESNPCISVLQTAALPLRHRAPCVKYTKNGIILKAMGSPERGNIEKLANISKKIDAVTVGLGVLIASAPVVFYGIIGYLTGDYVEKKFKKH